MASSALFTATDGTRYYDKKRYFWLFSLIIPTIAVGGPIAYLATEQIWTLWFFIVFVYGFLPFVDWVMGEDTSNPPEQVVPELEADHYYRYVIMLQVPVIWAAFLFFAWFVGTQNLPWYGVLAVALTAGMIGGYGLNLGHELGHKKTSLERWMAKIILAPAAYGHFFIEHNKGHHRDVATPEDPASSKMGQTIYRFVLTEIPGAFVRAWRLEKDRLAKEGKGPWHYQNEMLQPMAISIALYASLVVAFGWMIVPYLALTAFWSMWQLTSANYIEHYGLLRQKKEDGRYERCQPHHSWNSNHVFSNWITLHLQRHSDHHAHAARRYQSLRNFDDVPSLPNGYFGMFALAYIPWLWFRVMNKRLVELVEGDASRINFLPAKKEELIRRYGLREG